MKKRPDKHRLPEAVLLILEEELVIFGYNESWRRTEHDNPAEIKDDKGVINSETECVCLHKNG
jgi:hypothetical protein